MNEGCWGFRVDEGCWGFKSTSRVLVFYGGCRVLGVSFRDKWRMESQLGLFIFMILVARGRQMI